MSSSKTSFALLSYVLNQLTLLESKPLNPNDTHEFTHEKLSLVDHVQCNTHVKPGKFHGP